MASPSQDTLAYISDLGLLPIPYTCCTDCKAEALVVVAALLPALSYPFLPSRSLVSCASILIFPYGLQVFYNICNLGRWIYGRAWIHTPSWVLLLASLLFSVGLLRRRRYRAGKPLHPNDFLRVAWSVPVISVCYAIRVCALLFDTENVVSLANMALVSTVGGCLAAIGAFGGIAWVRLAQAQLCALAARRVWWWTWLPKDDVDDQNFNPLWSRILSAVMHVLCMVFSCFAAWAVLLD